MELVGSRSLHMVGTDYAEDTPCHFGIRDSDLEHVASEAPGPSPKSDDSRDRQLKVSFERRSNHSRPWTLARRVTDALSVEYTIRRCDLLRRPGVSRRAGRFYKELQYLVHTIIKIQNLQQNLVCTCRYFAARDLCFQLFTLVDYDGSFEKDNYYRRKHDLKSYKYVIQFDWN
ncbi:hypothetical protein EVAR_28569_1 [Eumeta japonica]|uniref:Uncharacterized protein n=1 Tax=Eumeta variegata TaxID=151549 RepID=A0A4C1UWV7_EUMVA|nr:hypothetical protein EVAR_28569_1 [Eumeta japonica]